MSSGENPPGGDALNSETRKSLIDKLIKLNAITFFLLICMKMEIPLAEMLQTLELILAFFK